MVPHSNVKFTASRKHELKKTACNPPEKTLNFKELSEFANGVVGTKKGTVVLYLDKKKSRFNGGVTYKVGARVEKPIKATKTAKADAARASESKLVKWMKNSTKPMLDKNALYSTQVREALEYVTHQIATQRVVLDTKMLDSLQVLAEATPAAPERECPAIPTAIGEPGLKADSSSLEPPIVASDSQPLIVAELIVAEKQPDDLKSLADELSNSLHRIFQNMKLHRERERTLVDPEGKPVAQLNRWTREGVSDFIALNDSEPVAWSQGVVMGLGSGQITLGGRRVSELDEKNDFQKMRRWLTLARQMEAQIASYGPIAEKKTSDLKEQTATLKAGMAGVYQDMLAKGFQAFWVDKFGKVHTDPNVDGDVEYAATVSAGPVLTLQDTEAYRKYGKEGKWGSVLMTQQDQEVSFRLNTKNLNDDGDFAQLEDLDDTSNRVKALLELLETVKDKLSAVSK